MTQALPSKTASAFKKEVTAYGSRMRGFAFGHLCIKISRGCVDLVIEQSLSERGPDSSLISRSGKLEACSICLA